MLNYQGLIFLVLFFVLELISFFIYYENLKVKYSKLELKLEQKPLQIFKQNLKQETNLNFVFKSTEFIFLTPIALKKKKVLILKTNLNNSILAYVNLVYLANLFKAAKSFYFQSYGWLRILQTLNLVAIFILSFLNQFIAFYSLIALYCLIILLDYSLFFKAHRSAFLATKLWISKYLKGQDLQLSYSFLKYKRLEFLKRHFFLVSIPLIYSLKLFKNWGK